MEKQVLSWKVWIGGILLEGKVVLPVPEGMQEEPVKAVQCMVGRKV